MRFGTYSGFMVPVPNASDQGRIAGATWALARLFPLPGFLHRWVGLTSPRWTLARSLYVQLAEERFCRRLVLRGDKLQYLQTLLTQIRLLGYSIALDVGGKMDRRVPFFAELTDHSRASIFFYNRLFGRSDRGQGKKSSPFRRKREPDEQVGRAGEICGEGGDFFVERN